MPLQLYRLPTSSTTDATASDKKSTRGVGKRCSASWLDRELLLIDGEEFGNREQQSRQRSIIDRDPILLALTRELLEPVLLLIQRQHCESRDVA